MGWLFSHHSRRELVTAMIKTDHTENYHQRRNPQWGVGKGSI